MNNKVVTIWNTVSWVLLYGISCLWNKACCIWTLLWHQHVSLGYCLLPVLILLLHENNYHLATFQGFTNVYKKHLSQLSHFKQPLSVCGLGFLSLYLKKVVVYFKYKLVCHDFLCNGLFLLQYSGQVDAGRRCWLEQCSREQNKSTTFR